MSKKLIKSWEREDGIEFKLYEVVAGKYYRIDMYSKADGHTSEYGDYPTKEEALKDFNKIN